MAVQEPVHHSPKSMVEGAACFGLSLAVLAAIAVALQWLITLLT